MLYKKLRTISKIDPTTNKTIKIYPSIAEAARNCGVTRSCIWQALNNITKTSAGYKWEYYTGKHNFSYLEHCAGRKRVPVKQIDPNTMEIINIFDSLTEAQEKTNISRESIIAVARGYKRRKTAGGYIWEYCKDV